MHIQLFPFAYSINPSLYATNFLGHQFSDCLTVFTSHFPPLHSHFAPAVFLRSSASLFLSKQAKTAVWLLLLLMLPRLPLLSTDIQSWKAPNATDKRGTLGFPCERILGKYAQQRDLCACNAVHTHTDKPHPRQAALAGRGLPKRRVRERSQSQPS